MTTLVADAGHLLVTGAALWLHATALIILIAFVAARTTSMVADVRHRCAPRATSLARAIEPVAAGMFLLSSTVRFLTACDAQRTLAAASLALAVLLVANTALSLSQSADPDTDPGADVGDMSVRAAAGQAAAALGRLGLQVAYLISALAFLAAAAALLIWTVTNR